MIKYKVFVITYIYGSVIYYYVGCTENSLLIRMKGHLTQKPTLSVQKMRDKYSKLSTKTNIKLVEFNENYLLYKSNRYEVERIKMCTIAEFESFEAALRYESQLTLLYRSVHKQFCLNDRIKYFSPISIGA